MARIELWTGQGDVGVILDARPEVEHPTTVPYDGTDAFHELYGGRTYYRSATGLSMAGWIPGRAGVAGVSTYRTDVGRVEVPDPGEADPVYGIRLRVPVSYVGRDVAADWPVIAHWGPIRPGSDGREVQWPAAYLLLAWEEVPGLLAEGGRFAAEKMEPEWRVWRCPPGGGEPREGTVRCPVWVTGAAMDCYARRSAAWRAIEALWRPSLQLGADDRAYIDTPTHWRGLLQIGAHAYKVRRGLAVDRYAVADLATREGLQAALPEGVHALSADLTLGQGRLYSADKSLEVTPQQEFRLLRGEAPEEVLRRHELVRRDYATPGAEPLAEWERELLGQE